MLECVRIALVHFDGRLSLEIYRRTNTKDSNNPTVCLRLPQYVIRFTELWMAQC